MSRARTVVRLVRLMQLLESRHATALELAALFGVTVRCIYRNFAILQEAGVALTTDEDHRWHVLKSRESLQGGAR